MSILLYPDEKRKQFNQSFIVNNSLIVHTSAAIMTVSPYSFI